MFIINEITITPIINPKPAGIRIERSKLAKELTYNSYNPRVDKITALSTPGTIDDPATVIPSIIDWNKFGLVIGRNRLLLKENILKPRIVVIIITR